MGLFDFINKDTGTLDAGIRLAAAEQALAEEREETRYLVGQLREAKEDMLKIADAYDNIGWAPLDPQTSREMTLKTVKKAAEVSRALYAMNPFVNRGVNARVGYVWGRGVTFDGVDSIDAQIERNRKKLFNNTAYTELERVLATDGNSFTALPIESNPDEEATAFRISLDQIEGAISNPLDIEEIWYYRREYTIKKTSGDTGNTKEEKVVKYYASMEYYQKLKKQDKNLPRRWKDAGVEQNYVIHHVAVNRQVGWRWGVPDIMPVIFWAKAYKEYLEDRASLVKAYGRLAWQIQGNSAAGAQAAGASVMAPPTRDPLTGDLRYVGGTAVTSPGVTATPLPSTGSDVDFDKGSALAAAIASGLQVSKVVITSDPGGGNRATAETLDLPTLKAMESRQQVHTDRFLALFEFWGAKVTPTVEKSKTGKKEVQEAKAENGGSSGPDYALVTWPQIESDSTKDRIAAIGTAVELGILYKQEARKESLDTLGIAPYKPWDELPTMEDDPAAKEKFDQQQQQAEDAFQQQQVIAKQGVTGGVAAKGGAQSTNNQARNNRASDSRSA